MARVGLYSRLGITPFGELLAEQQDLQAFIRDAIRSVWALELLLIMKREPERLWTPEDLVRELRASGPLVADNLAIFESIGLVLPQDSAYRYAPASPVLADLCDRLESLYRQKPVSVINAIAGSARDRLQTLADAFKLRGDQ
jgi:hypothetical protein